MAGAAFVFWLVSVLFLLLDCIVAYSNLSEVGFCKFIVL